jgi:glycosyltransferase involved in cell wall biosynthesis
LSTRTSPIKLTFLVRDLDYGGAQRQLISLVKALDQKRFSVSVITFYSGALEQELANIDVRVISLHKQGRWDIFGFLRRLVTQVRRDRPDVLHGYLDIPNLITVFLKLFVRTKAVWGLRASVIELEHYDWLHRLASQLERRFARCTDLLIINSAAGLEQHLARGFPREKLIVIPNGFDTEVFKPDPGAGEKVRREWGVAAQTTLVGIVGRLDPMKDHQNFLRAAASVVRRGDDGRSTPVSRDEVQDLRFVCVGDGPAIYLEELKALANDLGLTDRIIWQSATRDIFAVYNALHVLVSASRAEGLPNVVGEAMACGVPCVVTDVGDSRSLVGDSGIVVLPRNPQALAEGIIGALKTDRRAIANNARARIIEDFSVQRLAKRIEEAIEALAGSRP